MIFLRDDFLFVFIFSFCPSFFVFEALIPRLRCLFSLSFRLYKCVFHSSSFIIFLLMDIVSFSFLLVVRAKAGGNRVVLCLETEDVEGAIEKAVSAGAVADGEVAEGEDACCGGRVGKVKDPYGFVWLFCAPGKKCADVEA